MTGQFAILDQELEKQLIRFLVVREVYKRGELIVQDVMQGLWEYRKNNDPEESYRQEAEYGQKNLELIVNLVTSNFHEGSTEEVQIETGDGFKEAVFFRDAKSPLLYLFSGVKGLERYCEKAMENIDRQNQTGFNDEKRAKLIVESPKARHYRSHRKYENLKKEEQKAFEKEFEKKYRQGFKVGRFNRLPEKEKQHFWNMFAVDYHGLSEKEKKEYSNSFAGKHRKMCRDVAEAMVSNKSFGTIPISPHYMALEDLDVRIQRQVVVDSDNNRILEFEYILRRNQGQASSTEENLFDTVLKSCSKGILGTDEDYVIYEDHRDRISMLIRQEYLILNFHIDDESGFDFKSILNMTEKIGVSYKAAMEKHSKIDDLDKRDTKILESIRVEMGDVSQYNVVYTNTTTRDLHDKYQGIRFGREDIWKTFVRDRTFPNWKEDNEYEDVKFYLCYDPRIQGLSSEFQIMDPIMFEKAEWGTAKRPEFRKLKNDRYEKKGDITDFDRELVLAFLRRGKESEEAMSRIFSDYYSSTIGDVIDEIVQIETIPNEKVRFGKMAEDVALYALMSQDTVGDSDKGKIVNVVQSSMDRYLESKGMGILQYQDSLWEINEMLRGISKDVGIEVSFYDNESDMAAMLHQRHVGILHEKFEKLAMSKKAADVAASLYVGFMIRQYNTIYGNPVLGGPLSQGEQKGLSGSIDQFYVSKQRKSMLRHKGEVIGYTTKKQLKEIKSVGTKRVRAALERANFDRNTITNIIGIYESLKT